MAANRRIFVDAHGEKMIVTAPGANRGTKARAISYSAPPR
jgi:hypothetical protein